MSDLTPEEQTQPPRAPRATRPKAKAYSARRTNRPAASFSRPNSAAEPTPAQEEAAATGIESETFPTAAASQPEPELVADDRMTFKVGNLTLVSRRILIWGAIAGGANFLFFLLTLLAYNLLGSTQADYNQNMGFLGGVACLSFIVPPALAFFAGLRATVRDGNGWYAAAAGHLELALLRSLGADLYGHRPGRHQSIADPRWPIVSKLCGQLCVRGLDRIWGRILWRVVQRETPQNGTAASRNAHLFILARGWLTPWFDERMGRTPSMP